jgi:hypothetical protein
MATVNASEQHVRMAARLYEMRDTARRLLGESYREKMAELGLALKTVSEKTNREPMSVAIEAARDADGLAQCYLLAAAVELAEPGGARSTENGATCPVG